jgi:hypothetical protein
MLTYASLSLKDRARDFLAATGLTHEEFARLLPTFAAAYAALYPPAKAVEGKVRHRHVGGGEGVLPQMEDKLLFILIYQKTHPLQTLHGSHFGLSQPQANDWIHHVLPVLQRALAELDLARNARREPGGRIASSAGRVDPSWPLRVLSGGTNARRTSPSNGSITAVNGDRVRLA